ncbi:MAG: N(G),N(G)-dimethylarginine dimethylaminohydrolase [Bacteroidetes bacterium]|jgi:dimethylargininase|nr:N(G),N(G)-dimethylarginine dimethylaminohydrolase [Bacteroidota bacterium]MBT3749689.1 N(G),N(G)-dimethylarginine dimethylaminohydrolase [Bacteroidota bacterium]MBT4400527.1 N(G),N(G)-dimethylarginine dimethylaminohydrolase [Bacteroidota bacterium]MBT4412248.1 N(G),N(G)-dimethylarginine dimethylaminohydrolase [Bacteroidota bacterium]MBT5428106.1 N(G),N(G)-dimethylarginine dimethylaminohydrolase [Bacteroidota bacterium]
MTTTKFKHAIVRKPCKAMTQGITTVDLGLPDFQKALEQHMEYIKALEDCGLEVKVLEAIESFPDSTFIEDVALCTPKCGIITHPGADSRKGESKGISEILRQYYENIDSILSPGTLEAGDVMMVDSHYYIGISERTNEQGAEQLIRILEKYDLTGSKIPLQEVLHLKTGVSYLENNNLLVCGEFNHHTVFDGYNKITIDPDEAYAANSLWLNGTVLVPDGFPEAAKKIKAAGYPIIQVQVSEFQKLDGGLSCLSLRF